MDRNSNGLAQLAWFSYITPRATSMTPTQQKPAETDPQAEAHPPTSATYPPLSPPVARTTHPGPRPASARLPNARGAVALSARRSARYALVVRRETASYSRL